MTTPAAVILVAAGLLLAALWRRCGPALRLVGLAALSVHATEQLHLHVQRASWERRSAELVEQKLRAVEARKGSLVSGLQRAAKGVSALPEALSALGGGRRELPVFAALESGPAPGRMALAVTIFPGPSRGPGASRAATVQGPASAGRACSPRGPDRTWMAAALLPDAGQVWPRRQAPVSAGAGCGTVLSDFDRLRAGSTSRSTPSTSGTQGRASVPPVRRVASKQVSSGTGLALAAVR
jgi:hypothetical protein